MRNSTLFAGACGLVAGLAGLAAGGPLDREMVDRDANWVAHVDVEAALRSTLGGFMSEGKGRDDEGLAKLKSLGIDPYKDIKGITVYGSMNAEEDGVAVVTTTKAADTLKGTLPTIGLQDFETNERDGLTYFSWSMEGKSWFAAITPRPSPDERAVVFAVSRERLEHGLQVLAGEQPGLKEAEGEPTNPMLASPQRGSFIFLAATNLKDLPDFAKRAQAAKETQAILFDLGESGRGDDKQIYADLSLTMSSSQVAVQVQQVAQGLVAMGNLVIQDEPDLAVAKDLLSAISIATDGVMLRISARQDSDEVLNILKKLEDGASGEDGDEDEDEEEKQPAPKKPGVSEGA